MVFHSSLLQVSLACDVAGSEKTLDTLFFAFFRAGEDDEDDGNDGGKDSVRVDDFIFYCHSRQVSMQVLKVARIES